MSDLVNAIVQLFKGHEGAVAPGSIEAPDGSGDAVVAVRRDIEMGADDGTRRVAVGWSLERIHGAREPRAQHELRDLQSFLHFAKGASSVFVDFDDALRCWAYAAERQLHPHVVTFVSKVIDRSAWWLASCDRALGQQAAVRALLLHGEAVVTGRAEILSALSSLGTKGSGEASSQVDGTGNQRLAIQKGSEETVVRVPERIEVELVTEDPQCPKSSFPVFPFVQAAERQVLFTATGVSIAKLAIARGLAERIRVVLGPDSVVHVGKPVFTPRPIERQAE